VGLAIYEKEPNITWVNYKFIEQRIDAQYYKREFVENEIKLKQIKNLPLKELYTRGDYGTLPDSADYSEKGIYLIRGTDLRDLSIKEDDLILVPEEYFSDKSEVKSEDILILIKGATIDAEWSVSIVPKINYKAIFNGSIFRIRLKKEYDPYFVTAFMSTKYFLYQKKRAISNTGIYYNDKESIENFIIPIPSPEIQKYIGDKVRKAEELREEAKRLKKQAEEILINEIGFNNVNKGNAKYHWIKEDIVDDRIDSDFYDLKYQVLIEIEKKFNCYLMEDIIVDKYTGKTPGKEYDDIKGIPLIVVKNVEENILNLDNIDRRIKDNNSFKKTEENDLLITRVGSVGVVSIVEENEKGLFLSDNVICLKLKEGLFNRYIAFYLNSIYGKLMVERWTKGAVQGVINYESINKFKIPIMDNNIMKEIDLKILKWKQLLAISKQLIQEAKQDVEDLIEGNFDMSKVKA